MPPSLLSLLSCLWKVLVSQSCPTLCDPMDCSPPGSFVHEISQVRILEWVAISFSRGSSQPRDQTHVSCTGRWILVGHPGSPHVHLCCCSVTQLCPTLCDHMDCSTSGFLSFTISRSLRKLVSIELVMPSNHFTLLSPPPPLNFSQHQGLF